MFRVCNCLESVFEAPKKFSIPAGTYQVVAPLDSLDAAGEHAALLNLARNLVRLIVAEVMLLHNPHQPTLKLTQHPLCLGAPHPHADKPPHGERLGVSPLSR